MTESRFYVEDTVRLRTEKWRIGVVDRTASNVDTHQPDPGLAYTNGIKRGRGVQKQSFQLFLDNGIPPRGTVLVTWGQLPWQLDLESILLQETDLRLVDRALLAGDIVKRSPRDTGSGTVIQASSTATLLQPIPWREAQKLVDAGEDLRDNFPLQPQNLLQDVPTMDLTWPLQYETDDFILFRGWVGRITDVEEELLVRLPDNSVVQPADSQEMENLTFDAGVGDYVETSKANLRSGKYVYGSYNASTTPAGFVADVRPQSLMVEWLSSRYPTGGPVIHEPPDELDQDDIESGDIHVYYRGSRKGNALPADAVRNNFELSPGDKVRFKDPAGAAVKYDGRQPRQGKFERIPRTDASGYDINVLMVLSSKTTVDVQWQDGSITRDLSTSSLIPFDVFDAQEELWPGEMVTFRADSNTVEGRADKVGIVQSTNARDRMATVEWIPHALLLAANEEEPTMLPGTHTGLASGDAEEVSLYDIAPVTSLSRRRGDYVVIVPSSVDAGAYSTGDPLRDVNAVLADGDGSKSWFGEVVDLALDGLLTVRLAACDPVRDVRVPWECTHLVWSGDEHGDDAEDDMEDETSEAMESETEDADSTPNTATGFLQHLVNRATGRGRRGTVDRLSNQSPEGTGDEQSTASDDSWQTDSDGSEESDATPDSDVEMEDAEDTDKIIEKSASPPGEDHPASHAGAKPPPPNIPRSDQQPASYASMFAETSSWNPSRPEPFGVLDGSPPADHHYATAQHDLNGKSLRRIQKEHKILTQALPDGAYVRTWEGALDCMRILLLGSLDTPYEYAPFIFDMHLDASFPNHPPALYFHSWTDGQGPCNPNLYEDGKVCLSLLGTWPGDDKGETWSPDSTILQIIVSLLGLVLVKEPYFNEAGYEARVGSVEFQIPSALYSERVFLKSRSFIAQVLQHPVGGFEDDIKALYLSGPSLLERAIAEAIKTVGISKRKETPPSPTDRAVSAGAIQPLRRQIENAVNLLSSTEKQKELGEALRQALGG